MLYHLHELNRTLMHPLVAWTGGAARALTAPDNWLSRVPGMDRFAAGYELLYRLGIPRLKDRIFLKWAADPKESNAIQWRMMLAVSDAWERPKFPLSGREVMLAGVPEGPMVGRILEEVEDWWIDADFIEDEFSLAERLKAVVQATAY